MMDFTILMNHWTLGFGTAAVSRHSSENTLFRSTSFRSSSALTINGAIEPSDKIQIESNQLCDIIPMTLIYTSDIHCDVADGNIQIIGVVALVYSFGFHRDVGPIQSVYLERSQRRWVFLVAGFVLERQGITFPTYKFESFAIKTQ
jgi:hypothetical protein